MNVSRLSCLARVALSSVRRPLLSHSRLPYRGLCSSHVPNVMSDLTDDHSQDTEKLVTGSEEDVDEFFGDPDCYDDPVRLERSYLEDDEIDDADDDATLDEPTENQKNLVSSMMGEDTPVAAPLSPAVDDTNCTVYVAGLPFHCTEHDIRNLFGDSGEIARVDIPLDDASRPRGIGFVAFTDVASAAKALSKDGTDFEGRVLKVLPKVLKRKRIDDSPRERMEKPEGRRTAFVANLQWDVDEEFLRNKFSEVGTVKGVRLMRDHDGNSRGFGFVEYDNPENCDSAVAKLNGELVKGRGINVVYARDRGQGRHQGRHQGRYQDRRTEGRTQHSNGRARNRFNSRSEGFAGW